MLKVGLEEKEIVICNETEHHEIPAISVIVGSPIDRMAIHTMQTQVLVLYFMLPQRNFFI